MLRLLLRLGLRRGRRLLRSCLLTRRWGRWFRWLWCLALRLLGFLLGLFPRLLLRLLPRLFLRFSLGLLSGLLPLGGTSKFDFGDFLVDSNGIFLLHKELFDSASTWGIDGDIDLNGS